MANLRENAFVMGRTPNYAMTSDEDSFVMSSLSKDTTPVLEEDSIVMGRTLLVFIMFELILGLGVFEYFV